MFCGVSIKGGMGGGGDGVLGWDGGKGLGCLYEGDVQVVR